MKYFIGIDPGTKTGFAVASNGQLIGVDSVPIHVAMDRVRQVAGDCFVIFEDARKRRWLGSKGREALQGAGSIKRDCSIWQDYLEAFGVQYRAQAPQRGATKIDAKRFASITGWNKRTNEHGRDAAMLVWQAMKREGE